MVPKSHPCNAGTYRPQVTPTMKAAHMSPSSRGQAGKLPSLDGDMQARCSRVTLVGRGHRHAAHKLSLLDGDMQSWYPRVTPLCWGLVDLVPTGHPCSWRQAGMLPTGSC